MCRAFVYEGFLTDLECDHLISLVSKIHNSAKSLMLLLLSISLLFIRLGEIGAEEICRSG